MNLGENPVQIAAVDRLISCENQESVKACVDGLQEDLRRVILLREVQDLEWGEVAMSLRIPVGTARSRRDKALLALRHCLKRKGYPHG